ncbi:aldehyde dehydrogenase family protein [Ruegeria marina]|uniref:aldehyde dehydrogenase family protein n=1 Tax=Ruegeria marina TaxID=639004 RepID=UPI003CCBB83F
MGIRHEATFGSVAGIMPVSGDQEVITLMNYCQYGLAASIGSRDTARATAIVPVAENGHPVHEPLRSPRPCPVLDRLQGCRLRRGPVSARLSRLVLSQLLPTEKGIRP